MKEVDRLCQEAVDFKKSRFCVTSNSYSNSSDREASPDAGIIGKLGSGAMETFGLENDNDSASPNGQTHVPSQSSVSEDSERVKKALFSAVHAGDVSGIEKALKRAPAAASAAQVQVLLNQSFETFGSPLYHAALAGNLEVVEKLLSLNADANIGQWAAEITPLLGATMQISARCSSASSSSPGKTGSLNHLRDSSTTASPSLSRRVSSEAGAVTGVSESQNHCQRSERDRRFFQVIDRLLGAPRVDPNIGRKGDGITPLHMASERGIVEVVKSLVALDSVRLHINRRTSDESRTALWLAATYGHGTVVELLVGAGADPRIGDRDGMTPLQSVVAPLNWDGSEDESEQDSDPQIIEPAKAGSAKKESVARDSAMSEDAVAIRDVLMLRLDQLTNR